MFSASSAEAVGFDGKQLHAYFLFPSTTTVVRDLGTATVGPDIEFSLLDLHFDMDFTGANLVFSHVTSNYNSFGNYPFIGFKFTDINSTLDPIIAVSFLGTPVLFPQITFDENNIFVNMAGLGALGTAPLFTLTTQFQPAASVPEPGTILLLASGLASLGFLRRRKRAD